MRNRTARKLDAYPLTAAYLTLCVWVTVLVTILEAKH